MSIDRPEPADEEPPRALSSAETARFGSLFEQHHAFIGRLVRRLGATEIAADDLVQRVFMVTASKLASIAIGSERAFLYATAQRLSADYRGRASQRHETVDERATGAARDPTPGADELLDQKLARQLLDQVLDGMAVEFRSVFVLFELERLTMAEIAELQGLALGTVASRLRRAREIFSQQVDVLNQRFGSAEPAVEVAS